VVIESEEKLSENGKREIARELVEELREVLLITPEVELVKQGALPRDDTRKAKRIIDRR
jgi:phenylacetate-coenzyme A ligase PaaK-like adenylate-forming protein